MKLKQVLELLLPYKTSKDNTVWDLRNKIFNGDTGCSNDTWDKAMTCCETICDKEDCEITIEEAIALGY